MAIVKNRLGRGLGALITGGTPAKKVVPAAKKTDNVPSAAHKPKKIFKTSASVKTLSSKVPAKSVMVKPAITKSTAVKPVTLKKSVVNKGVIIKKEAQSQHPVANKNNATPSVLKDLPDYLELPIDKIEHNPHQPRRDIDAQKVEELADSIRSEGLLQPVVVRVVGNHYQLIAGERRLRACRLMGFKTIPCRILKVSDASSAVLALIENLQREGLNPIDESMGYASLMRDFDLTQESVAERVGKNRSTIANALRLLQLDKEIQSYLAKYVLSTGHAKVIAGVEDKAQQLLIARRVIEEGLSVRQTEDAVRRIKSPQSSRLSPVGPSPSVDMAVKNLERQIGQSLGTKVMLKHTPKKGRLVIEYHGNDDLQRILEKTGLGHIHFDY